MSFFLALGALCFGLLAWTWLAYPALVIGVSRLLPKTAVPTAPQAPLPTLSVVIATNGGADAAIARIEDVRRGTYPADLLQVVLALDSAMPEPMRAAAEQIASTHAVTVVSAVGPAGKANAVNAGVAASAGEVVVFTDIQQQFEPDAIEVMARRLLSSERVAVVGGALQLPGDRPGATRSPVEWYWAGERALRAAEARLHSSVGVSGSIYAMRRSDWVAMPAGLILDDVFVPMQQVLRGRRVEYVLNARAWDSRRTSAESEQKRKIRTLTGNFQLVAWLPALLVPFRNPIWVQFISHKLLRLASPWLLLGIGVAVLGAALSSDTTSLTFRGTCALLITGLLALLLPPVGRRVRPLIRWITALNTALVRATLNGARGHWDVW